MTKETNTWLKNKGKMRALIAEKDWSQTPLGSMDEWPITLRANLNLILDTQCPAAIFWGNKLVAIYNHAYRSLFDENSDSLGRPFFNLEWENAHAIKKIVKKAEYGEANCWEKYRLKVNRDDQPRHAWFDLHFSPLRNQAGEVKGVLNTAVERTQQVKYQQAAERVRTDIKQQTDLYEKVLSTISDYVFVLNTEGRFVYANQPFLELLDTIREEISGKTFSDLPLPGELATRLQHQANEVHETLTEVVDETLYTRPSGKSGYYEYILKPVLDDENKVEYIAGSMRNITERERILEETENHLGLATEAADLHLCKFDLVTGTFEWEENVVRYVNFPLPKTLEEAEKLLHPQDKNKVLDKLTKVAGKGGDFEIEYRIIDPTTREIFWIYSAGKVVNEIDGKFTHVVAVSKQITERKRTEEREQFIARLSLQLQQISEPDEIISTTTRMVGEHLNADRCTFAEFEDGDHYFILDSYNQDDMPSMEYHGTLSSFGDRAVEKLSHNKAFVVRNIDKAPGITRKDKLAFDRNKIKSLVCAPLLKNGQLIAKFAVHKKSTQQWRPDEIELLQIIANRSWEALERARLTRELKIMNKNLEKRVEERTAQVREQEERYRKLIEASAQMVWMTNAEGYPIEDSPSWRSFTGQTFEEWQGEGWLDVIHPADRRRVKKAWYQAVEKETPFDIELRLYHAESDSWHWVKERAVPLRNSEAEVRGWIGMSTDISERKETEEKQRIYQRQLRSLALELNKTEERERQRLAAELHNNFGQVLAIAKMKLDTLGKTDFKKEFDEELTDLTDLVDDAVSYTREMISDLKPPPALDKENFVNVIKWVAQKMEKYGLKATVEAEQASQRIDKEIRTILRRSVNELLHNVIEHAETDEARITITNDKNGIKIIVEDEGMGFDVEEEGFKPDNKGGFGLFNIRERMIWLGGEFEIVSKPGHGTKAIIKAPVEIGTKVEEGEVKEATVSSYMDDSIKEEEKKIRVLLVDDHEMMRTGLRRLIEEEEDMTIIAEASNGEDGIKLALDTFPDVIIMDINLPGMDGIEATRQITTAWEEACIIGLSLYNSKEVARNMRDAGAVAYLSKTQAFDSLCNTIREHIN
ncbi:MAG TPA: PAS domain-containing protein [Balneolaceae bacterium]|nr:PAS domain-containing protein [Balneolaceae bacterium]